VDRVKRRSRSVYVWTGLAIAVVVTVVVVVAVRSGDDPRQVTSSHGSADDTGPTTTVTVATQPQPTNDALQSAIASKRTDQALVDLLSKGPAEAIVNLVPVADAAAIPQNKAALVAKYSLVVVKDYTTSPTVDVKLSNTTSLLQLLGDPAVVSVHSNGQSVTN